MKTYRLFITGILCVVFVYLNLLSSEKKVKSEVTAVTVYRDRALITRTVVENLSAGDQKLIIEGLSETLSDQSLMVSGETEGTAKILDVKVQTIFSDPIPVTSSKDIEQKIKTLNAEVKTINNILVVLQSQINFIDSMKESYAKSIALGNAQKINSPDWEKILQFVERNKNSIFSRIEEKQKNKMDLQEKIELLEMERNETQNVLRKIHKQVEVLLNVSKAGRVNLTVSYIVPEASWTPSYEARVSSEDSTMQLVYTGMVRQSTQEDWSNIDLTLSTAQPITGRALPVINPWYVDFSDNYPRNVMSRADGEASKVVIRGLAKKMQIPMQGRTLYGGIYDAVTGDPLIGANIVVQGTSLGAAANIDGEYIIFNVIPGNNTIRVSYVGYSYVNIQNVMINEKTATRRDVYLSPQAITGEEVIVTAQARGQQSAINQQMSSNAIANVVSSSVNVESSRVETQPASSIFKIASKAIIPSDNEHHKVGIAVEQLPVAMEYITIPKLNPSVFLKARAKNNTEYLFLAGPVNVFFDNSFVALSHIPLVFPQDTLSVNLGVDEGIRVERKLISRYTEITGTFTKSTKITYDFILTAKNLRKHAIMLSLKDQVPISQNEKIIVEVLEPKPKQKMTDENGIFDWKLLLQPDEKQTIKLKFSIEAPREMHIGGLE
jgi:Domain of unknown function (DUF4139)/N-terminal domain of unknown function (DUF4140)